MANFYDRLFGVPAATPPTPITNDPTLAALNRIADAVEKIAANGIGTIPLPSPPAPQPPPPTPTPPPTGTLPAWADTPVGRWWDQFMWRGAQDSSDRLTGRRMAYKAITRQPGLSYYQNYSLVIRDFYFGGDQNAVAQWAQDGEYNTVGLVPDVPPPA